MSARAKRKMTLGMMVGNRGFFPDHLARAGHQEMKAALETAGVDVIALTEAESKFGAVETRQEAARCAALFAGHRARPAAFNTVRYSEKILEANGISVETIDLSEVLGRIARMKDDDSAAQKKLQSIRKYVSTQ